MRYGWRLPRYVRTASVHGQGLGACLRSATSGAAGACRGAVRHRPGAMPHSAASGRCLWRDLALAMVRQLYVRRSRLQHACAHAHVGGLVDWRRSLGTVDNCWFAQSREVRAYGGAAIDIPRRRLCSAHELGTSAMARRFGLPHSAAKIFPRKVWNTGRRPSSCCVSRNCPVVES